MEHRRRWRVADGLVALCGLWAVGLGVYFIFMRPALLPEDARYMGADIQALQAVAPRLAAWLDKVFVVMGGFMAGLGSLTLYFAWKVLPLRLPGTFAALVLTGAISVALMSAVNFALNSDFKWLLVLPPIAWAIAVSLLATEAHSHRADPKNP